MVSLVFGIVVLDAEVLGTVAVLLGAVAMVAAYLPSAKATRVDPLDALRV